MVERLRRYIALIVIYLAAIPFSIGIGAVLFGVPTRLSTLYALDNYLEPIGGIGHLFIGLGLIIAVSASMITRNSNSKKDFYTLLRAT